MKEKEVFNEAERWDFEKYESVILYLHAYCEKCMTPDERSRMFACDDNDYQVPVSTALLQQLDFEESFEEFCNEVQVMHEDMTVPGESISLITLTRAGESAILTVDMFILRIIANLTDDGDDIDFEEFFSDLNDE